MLTIDDIDADFKFCLRYDDSVVLHTGTVEISDFALKYQDVFVVNMFDFMKSNGGVGLAAPQIGLPFKFFIMDTLGDKPRVCVNPIIHSKSETLVSFKEGCLSYPGLYLALRRAEAVMVSYNDVDGTLVHDTLFGYAARVFQHEYDHLRGIVFTEHAGNTKLKIAKSKIKHNLKKKKKSR